MNKKEMIVTCAVGAVILLIYVFALVMGVDYNQIYGVTIVQILYIMFICGYAAVLFSRKLKEERQAEMIPIKVDEDDNMENQNIIIKDED